MNSTFIDFVLSIALVKHIRKWLTLRSYVILMMIVEFTIWMILMIVVEESLKIEKAKFKGKIIILYFKLN